METGLPDLSGAALIAAFGVAVIASFVKGAIGFAMPTIMISGLASFLPPEIALAGLILPTLVTNLVQILRGGAYEAIEVVVRFRVYVVVVLIMIGLSAQLVTIIPQSTMLLVIGLPVTIFAALQLAGWNMRIRDERRSIAEFSIGLLAGFSGGVSGVWGPPTVAYLTALQTPKTEAIRIQGVIYGAGAVVLMLAHVRSGVLNRATLPLSAMLVAPSLVGMWLGILLQDRMDQVRFRRWTLIVLIIAGGNLLRRAIMP